MRTIFKISRLKYVLSITAGLALMMIHTPVMFAQDTDDVMELVTGDIDTVPVKNLTRVSVTDPDIADVSDAKADKVSVLGKKAGQTILFLWDDSGKRNIKIHVVSEELSTVKVRVQKILDKSGIDGVSLEENANEGKVIVSGVISKEDKNALEKVLEPYGDKILNLVKEEKNEDLVQVDMQIVEVNTSVEKNLGISWGSSVNGQQSDNLQLSYPETLPSTDGKPGDFFKIGDFNRTSPLTATVNALIKNGKARLLSKPRLVVVSGKEASFLVGGEIPIQSTTTSTTGSTVTENTTFKQYGVNMTVTPTVREGKIDVLLNVEIRDIDNSKPTGNDIAFITRTAQTNLFMDNGQTIVLAGLIKHSDSEEVRRVPFVSNIPIVGLLFRNRRTPTPDSDTELVIILTPNILRDKKFLDKQTVMPTPKNRDLIREVESQYEHQPVEGGSVRRSAVMPQAAVPMQAGDLVTSYARSIQEKISQAISFPYEALQNNWQGTVKLKLRILKDGTLATAEVVEGSGHDVFDQDALNTAKIVGPYMSFPVDMDQDDLTVTIPIVYSQNSPNAQATTVVASY